jgi:hypothetical protein
VPSSVEVETYQQAQRDVATLALADLARFWREVDTANAAETALAVREFFPDLISIYGGMSALIASDFYMQLRETAEVADEFFAEIADEIPADQASAVAGWAVGPLFEDPNADKATILAGIAGGVAGGAITSLVLRRLSDGAYRLVQQQGRDTLDRAVQEDPAKPRFARVPSGRTTCAFCLLLASRGAVYWSSETAGSMNRYHGFCDCQPTPIFEGQSMPYRDDVLYRFYQHSRNRADGHSDTEILSQLRKDFDLA